MNSPRRPPPPRQGPPADPNAELIARLFEVLDAFEDACTAVIVQSQCALSELVINAHSDGYIVDSSGMIYDSNGAEKAPRLFPDDPESSSVTAPESNTP